MVGGQHLLLCVGVKRKGAGNAAHLAGTERKLADTTLKRSGKRVNLSWVEIRQKATIGEVGGARERQSMK